MKYLIAQGPAYYGVEIRPLTDDEYDKVKADMNTRDVALGHNEGGGTYLIDQTDDGTLLILTDSGGFDTGWREEGRKALAGALKTAGVKP